MSTALELVGKPCKTNVEVECLEVEILPPPRARLLRLPPPLPSEATRAEKGRKKPSEETFDAAVVRELCRQLTKLSRQHTQTVNRLEGLVEQTRAELSVERQVRTQLINRLRETRAMVEVLQIQVVDGHKRTLDANRRSLLLKQAAELPWYAARQRKKLLEEAREV